MTTLTSLPGRELLQTDGPFDTLLVPCGGGGLLSGSALAAKGHLPECRVIGIEPAVADDATRSFRTGVLHTIENPPTIADGTRTPSLGALTFPLGDLGWRVLFLAGLVAGAALYNLLAPAPFVLEFDADTGIIKV